MRRMKPTVIALTLLLFTHCQSEDRAEGGAARGKADSQALAAGYAAQAAFTAQAKGEDVRFPTSDGIVIAGTLYPAGKQAPAVLCLHQWRSDRSSFTALAGQLQAAGITVLTIDMRGYGGSTKTEAGKRIRPDRKAQKDIEAALRFMRTQASVDASRIGLVGASYGSSNAIIHAADDATIRAVALLSPGLNYFNELPTEDAVRSYAGRPLLAVASSEDLRSVETVDAYRAIAPSMETKIYRDAGHGTDILDAGVGLGAEILAFLKKNL
ncbi:MAG: alpha/beta fold hydrolase [Bacteroidota bacterium]|nr:alpha/beta fold hydrolase [Bacteroidota bacterium]